MPTFKIKLTHKEDLAFKTKAFFFQKPPDFNFRAGQYGKFTLINSPRTDIKGDTRSFSFASSPSEKELMIAIRIRNSAFKQILDSLPLNSEISLQSPLSMFNLPKTSDKPIVFLSGGIGVAAARPLILQALQDNFTNQIYLFNSNRLPKDIPFFEEFQKLAKNHSNLTYIPNITKKNSEWQEESGYLTSKKLIKHVPNPLNAIYYLVGPSRFMWGMYKILQELGIKENNINFDEFTGY